MSYNLDLVDDIPYYTHISKRPFLWFSKYNKGDTIREVDRYSSTSFDQIPKHGIRYFGLYGGGLHIISDFLDGSMYIYGSGFEKEFRYQNYSHFSSSIFLHSIDKKEILYSIRPFQLKAFAYDLTVGNNIYNIDKIQNTTTRYYAGYDCILLIENEYPLKFRRYFSIDIFNHPRTIGIISKAQTLDNIDYPDKDYFFMFKESVIKNYNYKDTSLDAQSIDPLNKTFPKINFTKIDGLFKHTCILRF